MTALRAHRLCNQENHGATERGGFVPQPVSNLTANGVASRPLDAPRRCSGEPRPCYELPARIAGSGAARIDTPRVVTCVRGVCRIRSAPVRQRRVQLRGTEAPGPGRSGALDRVAAADRPPTGRGMTVTRISETATSAKRWAPPRSSKRRIRWASELYGVSEQVTKRQCSPSDGEGSSPVVRSYKGTPGDGRAPDPVWCR